MRGVVLHRVRIRWAREGTRRDPSIRVVRALWPLQDRRNTLAARPSGPIVASGPVDAQGQPSAFTPVPVRTTGFGTVIGTAIGPVVRAGDGAGRERWAKASHRSVPDQPRAAARDAAMTDARIVVPARFASTRLPGKPLVEIGGVPMVVRVARRGAEAGLGRVIVATDDERVAQACDGHGVEWVMTRVDHASGSDRVHEALERTGGADGPAVVLQGDLPLVDPAHIRIALATLDDGADIATLATVIEDTYEATNPNVVKVIATPQAGSGLAPGDRLRALYFTRATAPYGEGALLHHIGLYAYARGALSRFVALPPGVLERRERLEQLRALENGMRIDIAVVDGQPLGVDTPADLAKARELVGQ